MYIQTTSKESLNENLLSTTPSLSARVQEKYLSFCERFVEAGVPELCRLIRDSAAKRVANLSLKEKLNISEIEVIVHDIMDQVKKQEVFQNPAKILLQEDQSGTNELDQDERESLSKLVADALDIFEAPDFKSLIKTAAPVGISKILDVLAEGLSAKVDPTDDLNFLNLNETRLPTAKFIPLMNNILVMSSSDASSSSGGRNPDPILTCFSQLGLIHRFSANVYEAFCQHEDLSSPDSRRPESPPISYTATEFVKSFLPF